MYSYGSPHMAAQKQDDQLERTFSSYVRIQVVVLKTYLGWWTIGRSGERGSGISVLPARYDDDDIWWWLQDSDRDNYRELIKITRTYIYIYITNIKSHREHGSPWPSFASRLYRALLPRVPPGYILYRHKTAVYRF